MIVLTSDFNLLRNTLYFCCTIFYEISRRLCIKVDEDAGTGKLKRIFFFVERSSARRRPCVGLCYYEKLLALQGRKDAEREQNETTLVSCITAIQKRIADL